MCSFNELFLPTNRLLSVAGGLGRERRLALWHSATCSASLCLSLRLCKLRGINNFLDPSQLEDSLFCVAYNDLSLKNQIFRYPSGCIFLLSPFSLIYPKLLFGTFMIIVYHLNAHGVLGLKSSPVHRREGQDRGLSALLQH